MNHQRTFLITLLVLPLLAGCLNRNILREQLNEQIHVFGVKLHSMSDYLEISGVAAVEEPCLKGYERSFEGLEITIGYGFDKKIRRITTRNAGTSIAGVKPGTSYEEGRQKVLRAGFHEQASRFAFRAEECFLILLVDGNNVIFGVTLEAID